jgi:hypothetical protein
MLITALIILGIILVIANIAAGIYISTNPPCIDPLNEYFESARKLPDDALKNLSGITNYNTNNIDSGNKKNKAVIEKSSYDTQYSKGYDKQYDNTYDEPYNDENEMNIPTNLANENKNDAYTSPVPTRSKNTALFAAVDSMFKGRPIGIDLTKKVNTEYGGARSAIFDLEMEGLKNNNNNSNPNQFRAPNSDNVYKTRTDGYRATSEGAF